MRSVGAREAGFYLVPQTPMKRERSGRPARTELRRPAGESVTGSPPRGMSAGRGGRFASAGCSVWCFQACRFPGLQKLPIPGKPSAPALLGPSASGIGDPGQVTPCLSLPGPSQMKSDSLSTSSLGLAQRSGKSAGVLCGPETTYFPEMEPIPKLPPPGPALPRFNFGSASPSNLLA